VIQVTGQGISCGEVQVIERFGRSGASCFLEPDDRLVGARLQQVRDPYGAVPSTDLGIAGAAAEGLFRERDDLVDRSG